MALSSEEGDGIINNVDDEDEDEEMDKDKLCK